MWTSKCPTKWWSGVCLDGRRWWVFGFLFCSDGHGVSRVVGDGGVFVEPCSILSLCVDLLHTCIPVCRRPPSTNTPPMCGLSPHMHPLCGFPPHMHPPCGDASTHRGSVSGPPPHLHHPMCRPSPHKHLLYVAVHRCWHGTRAVWVALVRTVDRTQHKCGLHWHLIRANSGRDHVACV